MLQWEPKNGDRSDLTPSLERAPQRPRGLPQGRVGQEKHFLFTFPTPPGKRFLFTFPTPLRKKQTDTKPNKTKRTRTELGLSMVHSYYPTLLVQENPETQMLQWEPKNGDRSDLTPSLERAPQRPRGLPQGWVGQGKHFLFTFPTPLGKRVFPGGWEKSPDLCE
jgi:hypothetical protein